MYFNISFIYLLLLLDLLILLLETLDFLECEDFELFDTLLLDTDLDECESELYDLLLLELDLDELLYDRLRECFLRDLL